MSPSVPESLTVSVVIPTLNAAPYIPKLLDALFSQSVLPEQVILVDSNSSDTTRELASVDSRVQVVPVDAFTHGGARNLGARSATGDVVVFVTQDALPLNTMWLQNLIAPFDDECVAAVCSRQIPRDNASPMERFFLAKRFPEKRTDRNLESVGEDCGYESVLFSDVSGAVRRACLLEHPFDESLIMGEDQQLSRDLIVAGYTVVYEPKSVVIHSHRYTLWQTFKRYFDSVYALSAIFPDQDLKKSAKMGRRYVMEESLFIARRHPWWFPYYVVYTGVKTVATLVAHVADSLPKCVLRCISMHAYHWK